MKKILIAAALTTAVLFSLPNTHSSAAVASEISINDSTPTTMMAGDTAKMKHKMWKKMKKDSSMSNGSTMKTDSTKN